MLSLVFVLATVALQPPPPLPVPFVPQQKDTCGAAALAMVLRYYGQDASQDAIAGALMQDELHGILGSRLAAFARERGTVAIAFAGDLELLRRHVGEGRPLIVALSAGHGRLHDVVVIGFDDARHEVVVDDPAEGPGRRMAEAELEERWRESGHWTLLVQPEAAPNAVAPADTGPSRAPSAAPPITTASASRTGAARPTERSHAGYDGLVVDAIAAGRDGRREQATALLDRATALDPARPEAWVEKGGLRFLDGRYEAAAAALRHALALRDDAYTRELLGSALQLAGRELEALRVWNRLGRPTLAEVDLSPLTRTRDDVARREIGLRPGEVLTPTALHGARRRLEETGAFDRVTLRPRPRGDGTADLEVALAEKRGFARGPADFLVSTGVNLAWQRVRLRYSNLAGTGIGVGATYRWQENRPEATLQLQWPRPFGLPGYVRLSGFRGEQAYDVGGPFSLRRRGVDLAFRHVLDGGLVLSLGWRASERTFSRARADSTPGLLTGIEAELEGRLVETRRHRLAAAVRAFGASRGVLSDVSLGQAEGELRYEGVLSPPEGRAMERSVLAVRLKGGWMSDGSPVDQMYAPGISPDTDLPLRAHPLTARGVIGANPVGRSLVLLNTEWRQRLLHRPAFDVGAVAFTDLARIWRPAEGGASGLLVDAGVGLRVSVPAGPVLRVDQAWGLRDHRHALFFGLSQAF